MEGDNDVQRHSVQAGTDVVTMETTWEAPSGDATHRYVLGGRTVEAVTSSPTGFDSQVAALSSYAGLQLSVSEAQAFQHLTAGSLHQVFSATQTGFDGRIHSLEEYSAAAGGAVVLPSSEGNMQQCISSQVQVPYFTSQQNATGLSANLLVDGCLDNQDPTLMLDAERKIEQATSEGAGSLPMAGSLSLPHDVVVVTPSEASAMVHGDPAASHHQTLTSQAGVQCLEALGGPPHLGEPSEASMGLLPPGGGAHRPDGKDQSLAHGVTAMVQPLFQVMGQQYREVELHSSAPSVMTNSDPQRMNLVLADVARSKDGTFMRESTVDATGDFHAVHRDATEVFIAPTSAHMGLDHHGNRIQSGVNLLSSAIDAVMESSVANQGLLHGSHDPGMQLGTPGSEEDLSSLMASTSRMVALHQTPHVTSDSEEGEGGQEENDPNIINIEVVPRPPTRGRHGSPGQGRSPGSVRKSRRIAERERTPPPTARPEYRSKGYYSTAEMWCEDCQASYAESCPDHKLQAVYDKVVLSRAWSSLPPLLQIYRIGDSEGGDSPGLGVFAKKPIAKRTQFGPYIAPTTDCVENIFEGTFRLQVERDDGCHVVLDARDENQCNWMMFVRPAHSFREQNLVAYQYGGDVFFTSTRVIEARQELKVWYSAHYAERLGVAPHRPSEEDLEDEDEQFRRWPCYECDRKFRTSAQLQKHLLVHEEGPPHRRGSPAGGEPAGADLKEEGREEGQEEEVDGEDGAESEGGRPDRRRGASRRAAQGGKGTLKGKNGEDSAAFQSWKKRKTNMYLNKLKKYREPVRRSIKTLYKRQGKDTGGQEWVCTHCQLTFDNPSLLNLHTLTHAAENVAMVDLTKRLFVNPDLAPDGHLLPVKPETSAAALLDPLAELQELSPQCPVCEQMFDTKQELIQHASTHAKGKRQRSARATWRPHKCDTCWKSFPSEERLTRHALCHGDEQSKPMQCEVCAKRFMNNSALSCHMKTHSQEKYYKCPLCDTGFDQVHAMKTHVQVHAVGGRFDCPHCHKGFPDYHMIRRHIRGFHSNRRYQCEVCHKVFSRPDKLKLHMLRHTSHREFMCETCGSQFKRKDKLKEHVKRLHGPDKKVKIIRKEPRQKKFIPKVSPNDYHRFIYKCHACLLGFKRRGMLVNHLAKRHPDIQPETVPELNMPILRTQRDYYCQYCDKVYKSSSKRKLHILKYHPGAELPPSVRLKPRAGGGHAVIETLVLTSDGGDGGGGASGVTVGNASFSALSGSVPTVPHACVACHKQYASKAKLLQHQRKKHSHLAKQAQAAQVAQATQAAAPAPGTVTVPAPGTVTVPAIHVPIKLQHSLEGAASLLGATGEKTRVMTAVIQKPLGAEGGQEVIAFTPQTVHQLECLQGTDLLTQAMTELTQPLTEYRTPGGTTVEYHITTSTDGGMTPITMTTSGGTLQATAIDLGQLLQSRHPQQQHQVAIATAHQANQLLTPQTVTLISSTPQGGGAEGVAGSHVLTGTLPASLASQLLQQRASSSINWASTTNYQNYR